MEHRDISWDASEVTYLIHSQYKLIVLVQLVHMEPTFASHKIIYFQSLQVICYMGVTSFCDMSCCKYFFTILNFGYIHYTSYNQNSTVHYWLGYNILKRTMFAYVADANFMNIKETNFKAIFCYILILEKLKSRAYSLSFWYVRKFDCCVCSKTYFIHLPKIRRFHFR